MAGSDSTRKHQRFAIESPITVGVRNSSNGDAWQFGTLCDIGTHGARFIMERPLPIGAPITLLAHFTDPHDRSVILKFEATVARAGTQPPYEVAVHFPGDPEILRGSLAEIIERLKPLHASSESVGFVLRRVGTKKNLLPRQFPGWHRGGQA